MGPSCAICRPSRAIIGREWPKDDLWSTGAERWCQQRGDLHQTTREEIHQALCHEETWENDESLSRPGKILAKGRPADEGEQGAGRSLGAGSDRLRYDAV